MVNIIIEAIELRVGGLFNVYDHFFHFFGKFSNFFVFFEFLFFIRIRMFDIRGQTMQPKTACCSAMKYYMPDEKAHKVCEMIIHRYLPPILKQFEDYVNDDIDLSRDAIHRGILTILSLFECVNFLPNWSNEEPIEILPTTSPIPWFDIDLGFEKHSINMPNGENVRLAIIHCIAKLQVKLLREMEDDTKSLEAISSLWNEVVIRRRTKTSFESKLKSYMQSKVFQEYKLTGTVQNIRTIFMTRVVIQQDCRDELMLPKFTHSHLIVLKNLLHLSTSRYRMVRTSAQSYLFALFDIFPFSYRCLLDDIVNMLAVNSNDKPEHFKGILCVLCGNENASLIIRKDWECVQKIWLALLRSKPSEKPSITQLLNLISDLICFHFQTVEITMNIPDRCVELAKSILPSTEVPMICQSDIHAGLLRQQQRNAWNQQIYLNILYEIVEITRNNSSHWRYSLMETRMIYSLADINVKYPDAVIHYAVNNLISESIEERNMAARMMRSIFKQQKRKHVKIPIDPAAIGGVSQPKAGEPLKFGCRPDNRWLQYELDELPKNQAQWDAPIYVHKTDGFFGWSSNFMVYAPSAQQPKLNRQRNELNSSEQIIYDFFANRSNIQKLIKFFSLEENPGEEQFSNTRSCLMKGICNTFGDVLLDPILEHVQSMIEDENSESSHRGATEIMAGIMKGIKHWTFDMTVKMYDKLKPLIRSALENITDETVNFWAYCFLTATRNFDPRRQYWLYEVLMENPLQGTTSSIDCNRIYCIQCLFMCNQHVWQMNSILHRSLGNYLKL